MTSDVRIRTSRPACSKPFRVSHETTMLFLPFNVLRVQLFKVCYCDKCVEYYRVTRVQHDDRVDLPAVLNQSPCTAAAAADRCVREFDVPSVHSSSVLRRLISGSNVERHVIRRHLGCSQSPWRQIPSHKLNGTI